LPLIRLAPSALGTFSPLRGEKEDHTEFAATAMTHPAVSNGAYDVARIRADFPALAMRVYGKPLVYLDNAASAQKPQAVLERLDRAYKSEYANVHRGLHYLANAATEAYEGARATVARFLNAARSEEIVFTRNATEAINLVAYTLARERIKAGDEIVLSIMEHHSNIVPWHFLRERQGAVIKWAPVDDEGHFLLDEFEKLLTSRTKMVAITHMSNTLGTLVPVKEVVRLAHARGIPVLIDGAQAAVHLDVDVADIGCDFYAFTGHKLYGPTGIGVLYGKYEHLAAMPPFNGGGEMIREVFEDRITYGEPPHRFEAGTPPIVQAIGLGAAIDYVNSVGKARIRTHEHGLVTYAHERLREINSLRILGTTKDKGPIVAFEMKGAHPHDVATIIDRAGVAVRAGTHCVMPLLARFGLTATCRASFGLYNTREEIDTLAQSLIKAQEFFA
jgi:cysteine desulfurase/selenocysteine lyase